MSCVVLLASENKINKSCQNECVEICHYCKTNDSYDNPPEFNAIVRGDSVNNTVGNLSVKGGDCSAGAKNK